MEPTRKSVSLAADKSSLEQVIARISDRSNK